MKETFRNLKKVYFYGKEFKVNLIFEFFCSIVRIVTAVIVPLFAAKQIVYYTSSMWEQVIYVSIVIAVITLFQNLNTVFFRKNAQVFRRGTVKNIQMALSENILKIKQAEVDRVPSSLFVQRIVNDTDKMSSIFTAGVSTFTSVISSIGCFGAILVINYHVFLYYFCISIILTILYLIRTKKYGVKDYEYRQQVEEVAELTNELIRGVRDIKMLNAKKGFIANLSNSIDKQITSNFEMRNIEIMYNFYIESLIAIFEFLLIVFLIYLTKNTVISVAVAMALFSYRTNVMVNIMEKISNLLIDFNNFNVSCNRVFTILDNNVFEIESFGTKHLNEIDGNITFNDVDFSYMDNHDVLSDLSFEIEAGQTIGLVGKSGVGKSTIFNLLCKLYDVSSGEVNIEGINVNDLDEESIRGNITVISQNPYIFNLSVKDNLRLVKGDITDDEIMNACKMACLDEFIDNLPDKYDTILGESGVMLSGGQKQRLAIARAFIQKTKIILFDEATSSLDNETQSKIQTAIENLKDKYTVMIIAHRLSTIVNCDKIMVLEEGKIIDSGSHCELLERNEIYQRLCKTELLDAKAE